MERTFFTPFFAGRRSSRAEGSLSLMIAGAGDAAKIQKIPPFYCTTSVTLLDWPSAPLTPVIDT